MPKKRRYLDSQNNPPAPTNRSYTTYYATPQYGFAPQTSQTNTYIPITTDVQKDIAAKKPIGTTTAKRVIKAKQQEQQVTIQEPTFNREIQDNINKANQTQRVLNPIQKGLDIAEYLPIVGDAISFGRAGAEAVNGNLLGAGLAAGLTLVPNIIENPVKATTKIVKNNLATAQPLLLPNQYERNREFLTRVNNYFYNYDPIPVTDEYLRDTEKLERAVRDRIAEHNTFLRGVRDPLDNIRSNNVEQVNRALISEGLEPTRENRLIYSATRYAGNTGHGRAGLRGKGQGTLYTSNSLDTAKGYASTSDKNPIGEIAIVRRPYTLGLDRDKWLEEGDFYLYNRGNKTLNKREQNELKRNPYLSSNTDIQKYLRKIEKDRTNTANKEDIELAIKNYNNKRISKYLKDVDNINRILLDSNNKIDVSSFERPIKIAPTLKEQIYAENLLNHLLTIKNSGVWDNIARFKLDDTKKQGYRTVIPKKYADEFDILGEIPIGDENFNGLLPLRDVAINPSSVRYAMSKSKVTPEQLQKVGYQKHIAVNEAKSNKFAFTTEGRFAGGRNNYQHYVFVGPEGTKGLEFVGFVPRDEWANDLENATRQHIGKSSNKYSRKTFNKGGRIYIKPENRGKFTALKERTGHSATWFKENGTPAQKKMAVFALNARKWKH